MLHGADTSQNMELGQDAGSWCGFRLLTILYECFLTAVVDFVSLRSAAGKLCCVQRAADSSWDSELRGTHAVV